MTKGPEAARPQVPALHCNATQGEVRVGSRSSTTLPAQPLQHCPPLRTAGAAPGRWCALAKVTACLPLQPHPFAIAHSARAKISAPCPKSLVCPAPSACLPACLRCAARTCIKDSMARSFATATVKPRGSKLACRRERCVRSFTYAMGACTHSHEGARSASVLCVCALCAHARA